MFKLNLHIHNLSEYEIPFPFGGKGQPFLHPLPPKSPVKPGAQGITKLLLILWGEPHKDKNHWEGVTPSPPGVTQLERGYLRGRNTKGTPADSGQSGCHRCWDLWALQEKTPMLWDCLQAHKQRAKGLNTKPQLGFLPLVCLFLVLLHDLWVPLFASGSRKSTSRRFPLTLSLRFFIFFVFSPWLTGCFHGNDDAT